MNIVNILGSPLITGNSAQIAAMICAGLPDFAVGTYALNSLRFQGCQGCMACKTGSRTCVQNDELTPVLEAIQNSDIVLFSSPVYFGEMSAQAKGFVDRMYSALPDDYLTGSERGRVPPGKTAVLIFAQGHPNPRAYEEMAFRYQRIFGRLGFDEVLLIRGLGLWADRHADSSETLKKLAMETAARLAKYYTRSITT